MIIAFKNKSLYNSYSKRPDKLLHQVTDYHIPLYKELGYPTTTLDKVKGKYIYYDNVRKPNFDSIKNNEFKLLPDKVKDDINNDKCFYIINDCEVDLDGGNWIYEYPKLLKEANINKYHIITGKTTYRDNQIQYFDNTYFCSMFERKVRNYAHEQSEITKTLTNPKKFLCVNRSPTRHRSLFMSKMIPMLNDFNASIDDVIQKVTYDKQTDIKLEAKPFDGEEDLSYWSRENCIYIITESNFHDIDNTNNSICLTEKTYKAMMLKLPFIIVGSQHSLKMLQYQGYKTFDNLWDESYDDVLGHEDRIDAITKLIKELRTRDLEKLVMNNLDILEHNYRHFMNNGDELITLKYDIERWFNDITPESTSNP